MEDTWAHRESLGLDVVDTAATMATSERLRTGALQKTQTLEVSTHIGGIAGRVAGPTADFLLAEAALATMA
jgi:hypothetical protein